MSEMKPDSLGSDRGPELFIPNAKGVIPVIDTPYMKMEADPNGCKPVEFVSKQDYDALLERLTTLETEVRTLKTQMKLAAGFIKSGY